MMFRLAHTRLTRPRHSKPIHWTPTVRSRGPSTSTSITLCHWPSTILPSHTGIVSDEPTSIAARCECALIGSWSRQRCSSAGSSTSHPFSRQRSRSSAESGRWSMSLWVRHARARRARRRAVVGRRQRQQPAAQVLGEALSHSLIVIAVVVCADHVHRARRADRTEARRVPPNRDSGRSRKRARLDARLCVRDQSSPRPPSRLRRKNPRTSRIAAASDEIQRPQPPLLPGAPRARSVASRAPRSLGAFS